VPRLSLLIPLVAAGLLVFGAFVSGTVRTDHGLMSPAPMPVVAVVSSAKSGHLGPLVTIPQTWNNCGPSSVVEVLAYWGIKRSQAEVQAVLRADGDALGMAPYDVPAYMRGIGMKALLGVNGSERLVKALISNGFPVIVDQYISLTNHVGHYRPIQAYDDSRRVFVSSDPYLGQGHEIRYSAFDLIWQSTNRQFIVLYPPSRQALLQAVVSSAGWNITAASRQDLAYQQSLVTGAKADPTLEGSPETYYLSIAWDQLQLGQYTASRRAIQEAIRLGASPIIAGWISGELTLATRT
jgi:predicted double-glycine peptidase